MPGRNSGRRVPEALQAALETPGLLYLILAGTVAGTVYGFAGFGAALIYMPVAVAFVDPVTAVAALALSALGSMVTVVPQAWQQADRRATLIMLGAAIVTMPFGIWVLRTGDPTWLRFAVSIIVAGTLVLLLTGWRYTQTPGPRSWVAVGSGVGFLGGATGLNGPIVILFQLSGQDSVERTRANTIIVLTMSGFAVLPLMWLQGVLTPERLWIGAFLLLPYALGGYTGRRLFNPDYAVLYRTVAYIIIGVAAVIGLPIWGR